MLFRFMETTRKFANASELPVSKNGNKFVSFRAKQLNSDGSMCGEMTLTVWGAELCADVLKLDFGDVIDIEGTVKDFGKISSIEKRG